MSGERAGLPRVEWHDLRTLTPRQAAVEWTLSVPWLALSLWCYASGWIVPGLIASFYFFLTGLRQAHGAQHYTLGRAKRPQDLLMFGLGFWMLASLHALQATHWHHHRHSMEDSDMESATARLPWWGAILAGPRFIVALHREGARLATERQRAWIRWELGALVCWAPILFLVPDPALLWHVAAMAVGECLTGFFAVWTVHHDCEEAPGARTQRGRLWNRLSYGMFYHAEHHLYPAVPTPNLPRLAERIDAAITAGDDGGRRVPEVVEWGRGRRAGRSADGAPGRTPRGAV